MTRGKGKGPEATMVKVVYFDEESASDYLDVTAGGKSVATSEQVVERAAKAEAKAESSIKAKLSWLPFVGVSAEAGVGANGSVAAQDILRKTLSNTILTDYLAKPSDEQIKRLEGYRVMAPEGSFAHVKMYTPYMIIAKTEEYGIDLARLDEALLGAKGYYEMLGVNRVSGGKCILRFNIRAFRNSYGLADLGRMNLTFHGILVGKATEEGLDMNAEFGSSEEDGLIASDVLDGVEDSEEDLLDVYDVILAGVMHVA